MILFLYYFSFALSTESELFTVVPLFSNPLIEAFRNSPLAL